MGIIIYCAHSGLPSFTIPLEPAGVASPANALASTGIRIFSPQVVGGISFSYAYGAGGGDYAGNAS